MRKILLFLLANLIFIFIEVYAVGLPAKDATFAAIFFSIIGFWTYRSIVSGKDGSCGGCGSGCSSCDKGPGKY